MAEKKKHHEIPRFYLKEFATPKDEILWVYDMKEGTVRASRVGDTAFQKHLYSVTLEDGSRLTEIEDLLSKIESDAAPVLRRFMAGEKIRGQDRAKLASFFSIMFVRTDAFRQQFAEAMVKMNQVTMNFTGRHDRAFKSFIEGYVAKNGPLSSTEQEKFREAMLSDQSKLAVTVDKDWTLLSLGAHDKIVEVIYDMEWSLIFAHDAQCFITSDNPVVREVFSRNRHPFYGGGFTDPNIEVSFPLSPKLCWLGHWNKEMPKIGPISKQATKETNSLRAMYARRFLYSNERDGGISRLAAKYSTISPGIHVGYQMNFSKVSLQR